MDVARRMIADEPFEDVTAATNPAHASRFRIDFRSSFLKFLGLLLKTTLNCCGFIDPLFFGIASNVFRYPHAAEMGTTHTAKMSRFRAFLRRGLTNLMPIIFARCLAGLTVYVASPSRLHSSWFGINFCSAVLEFCSFLLHPVLNRFALINRVFRCVFPHILSDFHAAEMWTAHRAEMS